MYNLLYKLNENTWLQAIKSGFLKIQSLVIMGCLTTVIINLPIDEYNSFMVNLIGPDWKMLFSVIQTFTLGIITIPLVLTISYSLAYIRLSKEGKNSIQAIVSSIISFITIILLASDFNGINLGALGAGGMAIGVFISLLSTEIFLFFNKKLDRKKKYIDYSNDSILNESIDSLIPATLTILLVFFISITLSKYGINNVFKFGNELMSGIVLFLNEFIPSVIVYVLGVQIFWFLGIHGSNIFDIINTSFFEKNLAENMLVVSQGGEATKIFTKQFFDTFVSIGGGGATICLIIAIIIIKGNNNGKRVAKLSILPGIFNINEIMVYGLPIIFNPIYLIPFILVPLLLTVTTCLAMGIGIVPVTVNEINWITPVFMNAYLATNSIKAVLLQAFNIFLGVLVYMPFVKLSNDINIRESNSNFEKLKDAVFSYDEFQKYLTVKNDSVGVMARGLGHDLINDLQNDKNLYLEYQPQVDKYEKVVGVEALLRWKHETLGNIPPNIIITIAQEVDIIDELGMWIIDKACYTLHEWNSCGVNSVSMSINISTLQLKNRNFVSAIKDIIKKYDIVPSGIKLEITESLGISNDEVTSKQLKEIEKLGVKLAIDDFGQGYNPILYIQKYDIDEIKLDGSLIKNIVEDEISKNIVKSMHNLCEASNIKMIAEFVETKEQKEILDQLENCIYQGYLFSKPLNSKECLEYIVEKNSL